MDLFNSYNKSNQFYSISKALENYPTNNADEAWLKLQLKLTVASCLRNNKEYDELLKEYESRVITNDTIFNNIHKNEGATQL